MLLAKLESKEIADKLNKDLAFIQTITYEHSNTVIQIKYFQNIVWNVQDTMSGHGVRLPNSYHSDQIVHFLIVELKFDLITVKVVNAEFTIVIFAKLSNKPQKMISNT